MRILVTGEDGQLGSEFKLLSEQSLHEFIFRCKDELDITNATSLKDFFNKNQIDLILNCAAYTAVDKAEDEKDLAFDINHTGVKYLVQICQQQNIKLIHFSTDYVFDGNTSRPYTESHAVSPLGIYGKSKLAGEQEILKANISALIIRTSWLYSGIGQNFVRSMLKLGKSRDHLNIVYDQIGTPTSTFDLACAAINCIEMHEKWEGMQKIYHFSNEGVTSWFDFALEIFEKYKMDCIVKPILSEDYPTKAKRPHFSVLDKEKFKADFNYKIRHWKQAFKDAKFNI